MPRSSKHKHHKRSRHSSKDYSDSEEDVVMTKDRSIRDENSSRGRHDSTAGEKRSSPSRDGKSGARDLSRHGNGEVLEEYVSSKRRKVKLDVVDRWSGGESERPYCDGSLEKEALDEVSLKDGSRSKESCDKGESLRIATKSKKYESGIVSERKEESFTPVLLDKGDSRRKHEKDSSARKEGKESKEKHRRPDREKNGGGESKKGEIEVRLVDSDYGKEHESHSGDFGEEKQSKRSRENTEREMMDDFQTPDSNHELDGRRKSERDKYHNDLTHVEDRRLSSKSDRDKDVKHRHDKHKDGGYDDKYSGDHYKGDKRREEKNRKEADKDYYYNDDDKYQGDGEKDYKRRDDRHRDDIKRSTRHKDGKHREDEEGGSRRKDDKYRQGLERDSRRDSKYQDGAHRDTRRKDGRYDEDDDKEVRRADEKYHSHGDRDDRHKDHGHGADGNRYRQREEKHHEDHQYDGKKMDDFDKEKRHRDTKYRGEYDSRDLVRDRSDQKSRDDVNGGHRSTKTTAYDHSPAHDDQSARYQPYENENDSRSRVSKDKKSDKGRSNVKTSEVEPSTSHSRRRGSPTSGSFGARDYDRSLNPDESKYRDYKHGDRVRLEKTSSMDYVAGSEKIPPSQLSRKDDDTFDVLSADRFIKSDIRSSPQPHADNSPSSSMGRRNLSRQDITRRNISIEELTHKGRGSREEKQYSAKDVRESRESGMEVPGGDELSQADADSVSISSPFIRNNKLSSSSKPPPSFRPGPDSPLPLGSAEDDARGRAHVRQRRMVSDPHMARISGQGWRGVTSWPSPVANGFMPFPHAPPVAFPSMVMQPFPSPPIFGVHPSMELNPTGPPYHHMPEAERFPRPGHPMGWRNQVNDPFPSLHAWDASNAIFGQDSHMYGGPDSDRSRNLPPGINRDDVGDLSKGPNRTGSQERSYSEKDNNNSYRTTDEVSADDVQVDNGTIDATRSKSFDKNDAEVPILEETRGAEEILKKDDVCFGQVYLSRLDISADLSEPDLLDKCMGLMDLDRDILSDSDDVRHLYVEGAVDSKKSFHSLLSHKLFETIDDSVYKKSMDLYMRHKESSYAEEDGDKSTLLSGFVVASHNGGEPEKLLTPPANDEQGASYALQNSSVEEDRLQNLQEPKIEMSLVSDLGKEVEGNPLSEDRALPSSLPLESDNNSIKEESKSIDSEGRPTDVSSEAVTVSRIHHHSP